MKRLLIAGVLSLAALLWWAWSQFAAIADRIG